MLPSPLSGDLATARRREQEILDDARRVRVKAPRPPRARRGGILVALLRGRRRVGLDRPTA